MISNRSEYNTEFSGKKGEEALALALDIRKFEIGLYWQRTAYFWALIAAAFAGYFAVLSAEHAEHRAFNAFVLACIGFVFSVAWFLVNRGSKFWQENWERHVDLLEDQFCGPLYKTVLVGEPSEQSFAGGGPVSVSRVNQWVSVFVLVVWGTLAVDQFPLFSETPAVDSDWRYVSVALATALCTLILAFGTRSRLNRDSPVVNRKPWLT